MARAALWRRALKLLAARNRSRRRLAELLAAAAEDEGSQGDRSHPSGAQVLEVLERLDQLGYLNDDRAAEVRARALLLEGGWASEAAIQRLAAEGFDEACARSAVSGVLAEAPLDPREAPGLPEAAPGSDERLALRLLARRGLAGRVLDERERRRAFGLLGRRGFSAAVVERLLGLGSPDGVVGDGSEDSSEESGEKAPLDSASEDD